jgi:hypothetical protein
MQQFRYGVDLVESVIIFDERLELCVVDVQHGAKLQRD